MFRTRSRVRQVCQFVKVWLSRYWFNDEKKLKLPNKAECILEAIGPVSTDACVLVKLFLCLAPLALARIIPNIVQQTVFRGLTRDRHVISQLAGFGIAFNMYQLFECSLSAYCNVTQVLVLSRRDRKIIILEAMIVSLAMVGICVLLSSTSVGRWSFGVVFNVDARVVRYAQRTLGYISMNAVIHVLSEIHSGIVIQSRETTAIFMSSLLNLAVQMVISLTLVDVVKGIFHPLILPILAIYAGNITRFLVIIVWYYRRVHSKLSKARDDGTCVHTKESMGIFVPLASLAVARAVTIPMARVFMSKSYQGKKVVAEENAVFSLILPVERLFNSWLNRLKDLYLAFSKHKDNLTTDRSLMFTVGCLAFSVGSLSIFTLIPNLPESYFHNVFNLGWNLSERCASTLSVFIFLPFPSCLRAHAVYWLVKEKQTSVIMPFVFLRLLALPLADYILMRMNITGAALGASLCVTCHGVEAILLASVALVLYYRQRRKNRNQNKII